LKPIYEVLSIDRLFGESKKDISLNVIHERYVEEVLHHLRVDLCKYVSGEIYLLKPILERKVDKYIDCYIPDHYKDVEEHVNKVINDLLEDILIEIQKYLNGY
jgi:hypothetical protein